MRSLNLLEEQSGFDFELFDFAADGARLPAVFFFLLFAARGVGLALEIAGLAVKRTHAVDRFVDAVDQALALGVSESQLAHRDGNLHDGAGEVFAGAAMVLGTLLQRYGRIFFLHHGDLLVKLRHVVDLAGELVQPVLQNLVGNLLFVEGDDLFDGAHTFLKVFAHREQFMDDDRRAGERFEHANLATLDALRDFHFAFTREQGHGAHLAQIHANGVVGFFERAGSEIEFNIIALFAFVELFIERGRRQLGAFEHINALRPDRSEQVVEVVGAHHILRDEFVYLVVG